SVRYEVDSAGTLVQITTDVGGGTHLRFFYDVPGVAAAQARYAARFTNAGTDSPARQTLQFFFRTVSAGAPAIPDGVYEGVDGMDYITLAAPAPPDAMFDDNMGMDEDENENEGEDMRRTPTSAPNALTRASPIPSDVSSTDSTSTSHTNSVFSKTPSVTLTSPPKEYAMIAPWDVEKAGAAPAQVPSLQRTPVESHTDAYTRLQRADGTVAERGLPEIAADAPPSMRVYDFPSPDTQARALPHVLDMEHAQFHPQGLSVGRAPSIADSLKENCDPFHEAAQTPTPEASPVRATLTREVLAPVTPRRPMRRLSTPPTPGPSMLRRTPRRTLPPMSSSPEPRSLSQLTPYRAAIERNARERAVSRENTRARAAIRARGGNA
ncbi:hypothetical protein DFH11DRAFT_1229501, partial [Phellopilus nigrolimitatus]